ncbi:MAG: hypothetical protein K2H35_08200 [Muribaculaceae bacterium]|nr:hypothetical protein [Muribaculaceae bacterium]
MKNSSKILISTGVAAVILAFFSPTFIMSKTPVENCDPDLILSKANANDTIPVKNFSRLEIGYLGGEYYAADRMTPTITIRQVENIAEPRLIFDKSWQGNMEFDLQADTLNISFPMTALRAELKKDQFFNIAENNYDIATIEVPTPTSLRTIYSDHPQLHIIDFHDADLAINRLAQYTITSSSFNSLTFSDQ